MSTGPVTSLHYAANDDFVDGVYAPAADGFNMADISSASQLSELPTGDKALVYLGMTDGVTAAFKAAVASFIGSPQVYGFYLADEPNPATVSAANLKAESDYIHQVDPGAKTFIVEYNETSDTSPTYAFTPANTDIDLFGLDPYPVNTNVPNGLDYQIIPAAVAEAEKIGIPLADIVPVYQTFGGGQYTTYGLPTPAEEQQILATWASVVPTPAFDYAYSWGTQVGDTALSNDPALAAVLAAHNAAETTPPSVSFGASVSIGTVTATTAQITVKGADSDSVGVSGVEIYNGSKDLGAATLNAGGTWSFTASLPIGVYALSAVATNAGGVTATAAAADTLTVAADSVTNAVTGGKTTKWTYNADGSLHDIDYSGLTGSITSYDVLYSAGKAVSATYSNAMSATWLYNTAGAFQGIEYTNISGQPYQTETVLYGSNGKPASATYNNGRSTAWTYNSDGSSFATSTGGTGDSWIASTQMFNASGQLIATATEKSAGVGVLQLYTSGLTVTSGAGTLSVKTGADTYTLTANGSESIYVSGGDTIAYHSGFGSSTIYGLVSSGASHDTLQFDASMFSGATAGASVTDWAAMLLSGAAAQLSANAVVTDLANDKTTIASTLLGALTTGAASDLTFV